MRKDQFFKKLKEGLKKSEYADRFAEELQDHVDDITEANTLKGMPKEQAEAESLRILGAPENVADIFHILTRKHSALLQGFDGILFGISLLPLFLFGSFLARSVIGDLDLPGWCFISLGHLLLIAGYYIFYSFSFSVLRPYFYVKWSLLLTLFYFFLPAFSYFIVTSISSGKSISQMILQCIYFAFGIGFAGFCYKKNYKGIVALEERRKNKLASKVSLKILLGVSLTLYIFITNILIWLYANNFIDISTWGWGMFMMPRIFSSVIIYIITLILFSGHVVIMTLVTGVFLSLFVIRSIYVQIKKWEIDWFQVAIILYTVPILFLFPIREEAKLTWHMPTVALSNDIEQKQLGIFHHFTKYTNQDDGALFEYQIESLPTGFKIYQRGGANDLIKSFTINFDVSGYIIKEENIETFENINFGFMHETLPSEIECLKYDEADFYGTSCKKLFFKNHLIYEEQQRGSLNNVLISRDQKWMLLEFGSGAYDPESIYLVKLAT